MTTREMSSRQKYRRPPPSFRQDDDSDSEEIFLGLRRLDGRKPQIIHSGHFMVSTPHCEHPPKKGYDFDTVNKQTCQTYHFGKASMSQFSIDASLTKLFECMTLAYSGKLVSPKWKNFKGLKLLWRDKIRLNNAIWRAWYMQYVEKRKNPVCHFVTPLDGSTDLDVHRPAEGLVSEGKYWKRRIEIVIREYHKWRTYFKKRLHKHKDDDLSSLLKGKEEQMSLFGEVSPDMLRVSFCQDEETIARRAPRKHAETPAPMELESLFDMDVLMSEISDTLFSTLASHQPIPWPNPREIAHAGNADMIQPGLIPLQPNLDFMDSFDPLQDLFHSLRQPVFPSVSPTASSTPLSSSSSQSQAQLMSSMQLTTNHIPPPGLLPLPSPMVSQTSQTGGDGSGDASTYAQNYMPLFPGQVVPGDQTVSAVAQQLSHDHLVQCLPGQDMASAAPMVPPPDDTVAPSVITHTTSSVVTPSNTPPTICHGSEYASISTQHPPSQLQPLAPLPTTPAQQPQSFALPRPFQPSSANKIRPVQRIAPANTLPAPHLIFTAPFPGSAKALIVTPTSLKADVVPNTGVVIASSHLGGAPGFHVSQTQTSPQPIVPKQKSYSSSRKNQKASSSADHNQPGPGPGTSCVLDQIPSPQSLISSSSSSNNSSIALIKNEQNQSRRTTHISAEQKRRSNINIGFKTLCSLVPTLKSQSNISNAVTLQKTVDHIGKLQQERQQMQEEVRRLREQIEELNASINFCQEQLPATGVPVKRNHLSHMQEKFNEYVKSRTLQNWKFWIFSIIIKPLFESFNGMVSTTSRAELYQTTLEWLDRHCSLPVLRPMVLSTLRQLSTTTSILSDPSLLPEEAMQAVTHGDM
ncbi:MLX-interacting protein isoform X1 [Solea senegalensis]|uniref:MLX-interacting protein isoform X1 n=1 Tax=Solea senegalensis TaxID=28829 RepID=A0AAV6QKJ7_SOLSE|nr:MLX-interacting protein isoform X1 [Solea senegalensis]KAG7491005.1 MLX-interacting protein isoform X1 [Solea senegalensis]